MSFDDEQGLLFGGGTKSADAKRKSGVLAKAALCSCLFCTLLSSLVTGFSIQKEIGDFAVFGSKQSPDSMNQYRWAWEPYTLEYALYHDKGYNVQWLESDWAKNMRKILGKLSPGLELALLRAYGLFANTGLFMVLMLFAVFTGRVNYHRKIRDFENVSSTVVFRAMNFLFIGILLMLTWVVFPFGVDFPIVGGVFPILADLSSFHFGTVWVSSPHVGFWFVGSAVWIATYFAATNFRLS